MRGGRVSSYDGWTRREGCSAVAGVRYRFARMVRELDAVGVAESESHQLSRWASLLTLGS